MLMKTEYAPAVWAYGSCAPLSYLRNKLWSLLKRLKVSMGGSICVPKTNSSTVRFSFTNISHSNSLPKGDAFSFHLQLNGGTFTHINHLTEEYNIREAYTFNGS